MREAPTVDVRRQRLGRGAQFSLRAREGGRELGGEALQHPVGVQRLSRVRLAVDEHVVASANVHRKPSLDRDTRGCGGQSARSPRRSRDAPPDAATAARTARRPASSRRPAHASGDPRVPRPPPSGDRSREAVACTGAGLRATRRTCRSPAGTAGAAPAAAARRRGFRRGRRPPSCPPPARAPSARGRPTGRGPPGAPAYPSRAAASASGSVDGRATREALADVRGRRSVDEPLPHEQRNTLERGVIRPLGEGVDRRRCEPAHGGIPEGDRRGIRCRSDYRQLARRREMQLEGAEHVADRPRRAREEPVGKPEDADGEPLELVVAVRSREPEQDEGEHRVPGRSRVVVELLLAGDEPLAAVRREEEPTVLRVAEQLDREQREPFEPPRGSGAHRSSCRARAARSRRSRSPPGSR